MTSSLVGSEMCIRDRALSDGAQVWTQLRNLSTKATSNLMKLHNGEVRSQRGTSVHGIIGRRRVDIVHVRDARSQLPQ
eukprot:2810120-Prorocentrum_lima.AAC.1